MATMEVVQPNPGPPPQETVMAVPAFDVKPSKTNPRHVADDEALAGLAEDIKNRGIEVPLIVRPLTHEGKVEKGVYELVCGHRRLAAAKKAKLDKVPVICRQLSDEDAYELQVVENEQRLNLHPLDAAEAFHKMFKRAKAEVQDHDDTKALELTALRLGRKPTDIARRMKLLDLIPKAKDALREGTILVGHAMELARLSEEDQTRALKWLLGQKANVGVRGGYKEISDSVTVAVMKAWIRGNLMLDLSKAPFDVKDPTLSKLGPCTTCVYRTGNNLSLFSDVDSGDLCTLPSDFALKRKVTIDRKVLASAKERGVKELVRVGVGWQKDEEVAGTKVDVWVGEYGAKAKVVARGDECQYTKPGILVYKDRSVEGVKLFDEVDVCINAQECSKHKGKTYEHREAAARPKPSVEVRDSNRIHNLKQTIPAKQRDALVKAVTKKAMDFELPKRARDLLAIVAAQMVDMVYADRWREMAKGVFGLDPHKFYAGKKKEGMMSLDYREMVESQIGKDDALPWLVASACLHDFSHESKTVRGFAELFHVDVRKVFQEAASEVNDKIKAIEDAAKKRKVREAAQAKAKASHPAKPPVAKGRKSAAKASPSTSPTHTTKPNGKAAKSRQ